MEKLSSIKIAKMSMAQIKSLSCWKYFVDSSHVMCTSKTRNRMVMSLVSKHRIFFALAWAFLLVSCGCGGEAGAPKNPMEAGNSSNTVNAGAKDTVPDALMRYGEILRADPNNVSALGNRGRLLWSLGRLQEARRDFSIILEIDPSNISALNDRARLLTELGMNKEAFRDWGQLITLQPRDVMVRSGLGNTLLRMGRIRDALDQFEIAMQLDPSREDLQLNAAAAQYQLGNYAAAREVYQQILDVNPQSADALNGMGLILQFVDNDPQAAEQHYRLALAINPNSAGAWFNIAFLEAGRGLNMKAIEDFGNAIRLDSTYLDARLNRGLLYINVRQPSDAVADLEWVTQRQPNHGRAWLLLGWARCLSRDDMQGCIDLAHAKQLGQADANALIQQHCK